MGGVVIDERTAAGRARRSDARDNRERLLTTAREVFAEHGVDASLRDVARRAGVGIGTLYRHFPDRQTLLEALFADAMHGLRDSARAALADPAPGAALVAWLTGLAAGAAAYRGLFASVLAAVNDESSALYGACHEMTGAMSALVERAREAGVLRAGVTAGELLGLAAGAASAAEQVPDRPDLTTRLITLAAEGFVVEPEPPAG
jgi:AcrR family transcriptional regulator